jgi:hypothetical protein
MSWQNNAAKCICTSSWSNRGMIVTSTQNPVILVRAGAGTFNNDRIIE